MHKTLVFRNNILQIERKSKIVHFRINSNTFFFSFSFLTERINNENAGMSVKSDFTAVKPIPRSIPQ